MLHYMLEQGALSVVGDLAFIGGKEALKATIKGGMNHADKIWKGLSYIPGIGMAQRWKSGNLEAAQKVLSEVYTPEPL
ncbi:hypothetical protein [Helicobacter bizzozeronii]|uniref:hypothetical protein n=1 Tax=Helicobacter bizzozeronii TaxID=56877 RepID=UPI000CEDC4F2|nr:hypothetical protein [Helicobacter bizzozeronii]